MYIVRIEKDGHAKHILYKTERGALQAIERIEKNDENARCKLFEQVSAHYKQESLIDGNFWPY